MTRERTVATAEGEAGVADADEEDNLYDEDFEDVLEEDYDDDDDGGGGEQRQVRGAEREDKGTAPTGGGRVSVSATGVRPSSGRITDAIDWRRAAEGLGSGSDISEEEDALNMSGLTEAGCVNDDECVETVDDEEEELAEEGVLEQKDDEDEEEYSADEIASGSYVSSIHELVPASTRNHQSRPDQPSAKALASLRPSSATVKTSTPSLDVKRADVEALREALARENEEALTARGQQQTPRDAGSVPHRPIKAFPRPGGGTQQLGGANREHAEAGNQEKGGPAWGKWGTGQQPIAASTHRREEGSGGGSSKGGMVVEEYEGSPLAEEKRNVSRLGGIVHEEGAGVERPGTSELVARMRCLDANKQVRFYLSISAKARIRKLYERRAAARNYEHAGFKCLTGAKWREGGDVLGCSPGSGV